MSEYPGCSYHVSYERESVCVFSAGALLLKTRAVATSILSMLKTIDLFDGLLRERKMATIISTTAYYCDFISVPTCDNG